MVAVGDASLGVLAGFSWRDGEELESAAGEQGVDTRDYKRQTALLKLVADDRWGRTWRASLVHQNANTTSDLNSMLGAGRYRSTTALEGDDFYEMDVLNLAYEFGSPEGFIDSGVVRSLLRGRGALSNSRSTSGLRPERPSLSTVSFPTTRK